MLNKDWVYRRGDIYYVDLNPVIGSEQGGSRPVVVIQNNSGNRHSTNIDSGYCYDLKLLKERTNTYTLSY